MNQGALCSTFQIALDVNIEHPVEPPAALSGLLEGVDRRSAGAVSIGVIMEDGFQDGLQIPFDDFLCDSVADRWDAQRPGPSIALGKVNPPHWRRKVAPRGHPIPEPVEVVRKINLKLGNRLSVYSSRSLVGLHLLEKLPRLPVWGCRTALLCPWAPPVARWLQLARGLG